MKSRSISCAFLALLVLSAVTLLLSLHAGTRASGSGTVTGSGCVTAGVEGGCLILTDFKSKKLYNLFFKTENKPAVDTAISFEGTIHEGPTICMQGTAIDVTKWTALKMKCPSTKSKAARERNQSMSNSSAGKCSDWSAWHDFQPVGPPTLHVTGKCVFPTDGYSVELKPAVPQGINPKIYILNKIVHAPTRPVTQVETTVNVDYHEKTSVHYEQVTIMPDNVTIPMKEVH